MVVWAGTYSSSAAQSQLRLVIWFQMMSLMQDGIEGIPDILESLIDHLRSPGSRQYVIRLQAVLYLLWHISVRRLEFEIGE